MNTVGIVAFLILLCLGIRAFFRMIDSDSKNQGNLHGGTHNSDYLN